MTDIYPPSIKYSQRCTNPAKHSSQCMWYMVITQSESEAAVLSRYSISLHIMMPLSIQFWGFQYIRKLIDCIVDLVQAVNSTVRCSIQFHDSTKQCKSLVMRSFHHVLESCNDSTPQCNRH